MSTREPETTETTETNDPEASGEGALDLTELSPEEANNALMAATEEVAEDEPELPVGVEGAAQPIHAERAIRLALMQKGIREEPCPTNKNPFSRYFGYGAQKWCADFVGWCFDRTGDQDKRVPWGYVSSVKTIIAWAEREGRIQSQPRRGQIFAYENGKHTGIVTSVQGNKFTTIEGNTKGVDGRTCWVHDHVRTNNGTYYFIRPPA